MAKKAREEDGIALPKRIWRVVDRCRGGERLCKSLRQTEHGETVVEFAFEPSARRVAPALARAAIETPFLKPVGDGLFGDETSQTWIAA
jgi:hypothetical protein